MQGALVDSAQRVGLTDAVELTIGVPQGHGPLAAAPVRQAQSGPMQEPDEMQGVADNETLARVRRGGRAS